MPSAVTTFLVAVSATSAVCYVLMTRLQNRRVRPASPSGDTSSSDSGGISSNGDGWSLGSLFGHASSGGSGHATDSCGWDSGGDGGGSDCGGGDGGGGGD
jgi:hypothetical protein